MPVLVGESQHFSMAQSTESVTYSLTPKLADTAEARLYSQVWGFTGGNMNSQKLRVNIGACG